MRDRFNVEGVLISPDHYINGDRVSSEQTFETRCPFDWDNLLGHMSRGSSQTADLAVTAATNAFPAWAALTPHERSTHLHKLAAVSYTHLTLPTKA